MMINHQRLPTANVLNYQAYVPQRTTLRESARGHHPASMFSSSAAAYPGMQMHMYAQPEYASPHQQHHHHHLVHHQQQPPPPPPHQQAGYLNQSFRRVDHPLVHRSRGIHQHQPRHYHNMAYDEDEFTQMQKLSEGWEPEVKGPLVGPRQSSAAIAEEYATADPIYQQKTAALPKTFSHYRTIRGDGRCGWRAIAFAFLEKLILSNDANALLVQETRIRSLSNVINEAGYDRMIYEDFADELFKFMRTLGDAVRAGNAETILLDGFHDEGLQSSIITHLRTLTAAWMKTHPDEYINYTPDLSIDRYVNESVLPYGSEIDHVGLSALNDVLLAGANIGLEVLYLDLTPGPEVNLHNFTRSDQLGFTDSCVRLLYRPGHYDILYKIEDIPPPPIATYLQISSQTYNDPIFDVPNADFMGMIPGMSLATRQHGYISSNSYGGVCDFFPAPTPAQPCAPPISSTPVSTAAGTSILPQSSFAHSTALAPPTNHLPAQELAIRPAAHTMIQTSFMQPGISVGPFRPSIWELEPEFAQATSQMPLQTSIFRNSHFNTAHFLNPDFQPEEWSPDSECSSTGSKAAKHKSSG